MLVGISASEDSLNSNVDLRFGRAKGFIIYNTDNDTHNFVDNQQNLNSVQGAGIQSAQNVINQNINALISGHCGPKAFKMLSSFNVDIYLAEDIPVKSAIEKFKNNELAKATSADVEGHW